MKEYNFYRNTWAEIKLSAIDQNIEALQEIMPGNSKMMAVVKANGYGHGNVATANLAIRRGVDFLMVALLEEALHLRKNGIETPILVIGRVSPQHAQIAAKNNIVLTAFDSDWIRELGECPERLQIHLEFETGMGRTGITSTDEIETIIEATKQHLNLEITGVYTHFATADELDRSYYMEQRQRFAEMLAFFKEKYGKKVIVHTGNSAAGIQYSGEMEHYTRFGIALYGLYPSEDIKALGNIDLQEAFSLYSELIQVKRVKKGEKIGYGSTYVAPSDKWIGTIPIGYADGWLRGLQGFHVLVSGKKHPIVGRVCMDHTMIELDGDYPVGTKVTLIGSDGLERITVDDVANHLQTINYEVTCMISQRVPRIYIQ